MTAPRRRHLGIKYHAVNAVSRKLFPPQHDWPKVNMQLHVAAEQGNKAAILGVSGGQQMEAHLPASSGRASMCRGFTMTHLQIESPSQKYHPYSQQRSLLFSNIEVCDSADCSPGRLCQGHLWLQSTIYLNHSRLDPSWYGAAADQLRGRFCPGQKVPKSPKKSLRH